MIKKVLSKGGGEAKGSGEVFAQIKILQDRTQYFSINDSKTEQGYTDNSTA